MKNFLLSFLILSICQIAFTQVPDFTINLTDNFCNEPDVATVQFGSTTLAGTYNFVSTNISCVTGDVTGTVEITQDPLDETLFYVDDFSFGLFGACFSIDPPTGTLNWKYDNFFIDWRGTDNYGEMYMFDTFEANGSNWTFQFSDTYGESATVTLTRVDGQDIPFATIDPNGGFSTDLSILWSTGETTPSIDITADGNYTVTVSDENGSSRTSSIQISGWNEAHPEFEALQDIYLKAGGAMWTNNEGWRQAFDENSGCNPCDGNWFGIECESDRVVSLNLSDNNLEGQLSLGITLLDEVRSIDLSANKLEGSIPNQFKISSPMTELNLSENMLSGGLPLTVTEIWILQELNLSENELSGPIPKEVGEMSNLVSLNLRDNSFSGELPLDLEEMTQLRVFVASSNLLTGTIPNELFELPNLNTVVLGDNLLTGTLPENIASPNFSRLDVRRNNLSGTIPEAFYFQPIIQFNVGFNNFEGEVQDFTNMSTFVFDFSLAGNQFEGEVPSLSANSIANLDLSYNNFSGDIPEEYFAFEFTRNLNLSRNQFTGQIPENFVATDNLRVLDLSNNMLTGPIPSFIGESESLFLVDLNSNDLSGCYPIMDSLCVLGFSALDTTVTLINGESYVFDTEVGFDFTNNPKLPWSGNAINLCNGDEEIGAPCDDGDSSTNSDGIIDDCICDQLTSIHEISGQTLTVYPNPVSHQLNIEITDSRNLRAKLYNSTGQLIKELEFNTSNNLIDLNSGIYILEVTDYLNNVSIIEKIIVE